MANFISKAIDKVNSLLDRFQVKQFLSVVFIGLLLLTTNANPNQSNKAVSKQLDQVVHEDDSQRPKTTGEWNRESRETEGNPGERLKRIGKESAEAVKDFGSIYPDTAKRSTPDLRDSGK